MSDLGAAEEQVAQMSVALKCWVWEHRRQMAAEGATPACEKPCQHRDCKLYRTSCELIGEKP